MTEKSEPAPNPPEGEKKKKEKKPEYKTLYDFRIKNPSDYWQLNEDVRNDIWKQLSPAEQEKILSATDLGDALGGT